MRRLARTNTARSHRDARVVGRCDADALEQVARPVRAARLQKYLRAAHARRPLADCDLLVEGEAARLLRLEAEQHGHDLAHARDGQMGAFAARVHGRAAAPIAHIRRLAAGREQLPFCGGLHLARIDGRGQRPHLRAPARRKTHAGEDGQRPKTFFQHRQFPSRFSLILRNFRPTMRPRKGRRRTAV